MRQVNLRRRVVYNEQRMNVESPLRWSVWAHAAVVAAHFAAHVGSDIWLPWWAALYVALIVIAGPFVGLWLVTLRFRRAGPGLVTGCMAAALVFGVINHFVVPGIDHVAAIPGGWWQRPFQLTAVALAATEALGAAIGLIAVWRGVLVPVQIHRSV